MKTFLYLSPAFILFVCWNIGAQDLTVKKDLSSEWMVYQGEHYKPFYQAGENVSTIYFWLDASQHQTDRLMIRSSRTFDVFLNGEVAGGGNEVMYKVDSLFRIYPSGTILVGVHQKNIKKGGITTCLLAMEAEAGVLDLAKRPDSYFSDFAILGSLLLAIVMVIIIRLNPKLASDYFSVKRMFSMREGDDAQIYSRITGSTNLLFYIFCSLLLSYCLMIIYHFVSDVYPAGLPFQAENFGHTMLKWLKLSFIVLMIFFLKIIMVFGLAYLFGFREVAGIHFFNWVRLLLMLFGLLTILLFVYVTWRGHNESVHVVLLKMIGWILGMWMILIFLKLSSKAGASMFHLFSYICATELIPFLIIVKVLYN